MLKINNTILLWVLIISFSLWTIAYWASSWTLWSLFQWTTWENWTNTWYRLEWTNIKDRSITSYELANWSVRTEHILDWTIKAEDLSPWLLSWTGEWDEYSDWIYYDKWNVILWANSGDEDIRWNKALLNIYSDVNWWSGLRIVWDEKVNWKEVARIFLEDKESDSTWALATRWLDNTGWSYDAWSFTIGHKSTRRSIFNISKEDSVAIIWLWGGGRDAAIDKFRDIKWKIVPLNVKAQNILWWSALRVVWDEQVWRSNIARILLEDTGANETWAIATHWLGHSGWPGVLTIGHRDSMNPLYEKVYPFQISQSNVIKVSDLEVQSNNDTSTQMAFFDKDRLSEYWRIYWSWNWAEFWLLDGDRNWWIKMAKDRYTSFLINNSEKMRISNNGKVWIWTSFPTQTLHVSWPAIARRWNTLSDVRKKYNIKLLESSLDKIAKLRWVSFNWNKWDEHDIWVIAQEVEEVYPDFVTTDNEWYKSVDYSKLVAPLIESIKELKKKNEILEERLNRLERSITK